jgi:hypothetical protein
LIEGTMTGPVGKLAMVLAGVVVALVCVRLMWSLDMSHGLLPGVARVVLAGIAAFSIVFVIRGLSGRNSGGGR